MLEEVLRHREGFFREVQILVARDVIGDRGCDLAAAQQEQRVALPHVVADVDPQALDLARRRRQNPRHPIAVEFDGAGRTNHVAGGLGGQLFDRDLRALGSVRLAAIGPKTADALRAYHLHPNLVPARYQSEDLAAALRALAQRPHGPRGADQALPQVIAAAVVQARVHGDVADGPGYRQGSRRG